MNTEQQVIDELKGAPEVILNEVMALIRLRKGSANSAIETALMSESTLAKDWLSPEEDKAWQHL
jgi:hypothetical protein